MYKLLGEGLEGQNYCFQTGTGFQLTPAQIDVISH